MTTPLQDFVVRLKSWMDSGRGYDEFFNEYLNPALSKEKQSIIEAYESGKVNQHITPMQTGAEYYDLKYKDGL